MYLIDNCFSEKTKYLLIKVLPLILSQNSLKINYLYVTIILLRII